MDVTMHYVYPCVTAENAESAENRIINYIVSANSALSAVKKTLSLNLHPQKSPNFLADSFYLLPAEFWKHR